MRRVIAIFAFMLGLVALPLAADTERTGGSTLRIANADHSQMEVPNLNTNGHSERAQRVFRSLASEEAGNTPPPVGGLTLLSFSAKYGDIPQ